MARSGVRRCTGRVLAAGFLIVVAATAAPADERRPEELIFDDFESGDAGAWK